MKPAFHFSFFFSNNNLREYIGERKRERDPSQKVRGEGWENVTGPCATPSLKERKRGQVFFRGNPEWRRVAFLDGMTSSRLKWDAADKPPAKLGEQLSL